MSEIKVNSIKGVGASSAAITVNNSDGTCTANITNNLSNRNLIINGAMQVAQRGTSSTSSGYQTIDRWRIDQDSGLTEACTQSQESIAYAAAPSPWASGFRKAFRITNGNQTSQDANDYIQLVQKIEAQDLAKSGWDYVSSSSNITLSFWVKASIAQTFYVKIEATDAAYTYTFPIAVTTSWQRLTKTIPGNAQLIFNDDNDVGMRICIIPFYGTNYTTSGHSQNTWIASDGANQTPDYATTWFSGNDATFDVTGVQLEVGSVATDFEHRSFSDELMRCYRYYQVIAKGSDGTAGARAPLFSGGMYGTGSFYGVLTFKNKMRTIPSLDVVNGTNYWQVYNGATDTCDTLSYNNASPEAITLHLSGNLSATNGIGGWSRTNNAAAFVAAQAEL